MYRPLNQQVVTVFTLALAAMMLSCTTMEREESAVQPVSSAVPSGAIVGQPSTVLVDGRTPGPSDAYLPGAKPQQSTGAVSTGDSDGALAEEKEERAKPVIYRGTDRQLRIPAAGEAVSFLGEDVSLNFEDAPLREVAHAILGDILDLDYVIDQPLKGQVTLRTRAPLPRSELLGVLESLLQSNNALLVRSSDGRFVITSDKEGRSMAPRLSGPGARAAGFSTIIVPLNYIGASDMADILKPVASERAFVRVDDKRNMLMLAGTQAQLDGWLEIVSTFDVDQLSGMSVGLFPLENSDVEDVADALTEMVGGDGEDRLVRIIPVKRLNSVLIVTPRSHYLDTLGVWIERLDQLPDTKFEKRLWVFPVQNTGAARLADLLNSIYTGNSRGATSSTSSARRSTTTAERPGVAPGLSQESMGSSIGSGSAASSSAGGSQMNRLSSQAGRGGGGSVTAFDMASEWGGGNSLEGVRVVADEDNNALMVYATGKQYEVIKDALEQLDVVATQVLIEASILEVTLTDDLRYGLEWTFNGGVGNDYTGTGVLTGTGTSPASVLPGFSYTVTDAIPDIKAVLNALSERSLINIISTPSVMVLDNHTAFIHVGDQIPVIDSRATSDASNDSRIVQSITFRDTGVKLTVTPSVNAGGLVTMDVEQSVTDVGDIDSATGQRAFLERNIMSRVAVRSNESVVLGGLIRENATRGGSGVPFLHDLPFIGGLFGSTKTEERRTELLVIITPRAIYDETELRQVSDEMRAKVRNMELIQTPLR